MVAKSKCVLVTGVAGFIGSNLSRVLLERGYSVIGVDNLSNGFERNIERYLHDPRFTFIRADITQPETFKDISGVDYAVHLAAYKIPRYGNILDTLQINLQGTENVLDFVRRENSKLVFASTSDVYGKNPTLPFKETDNLVLGNSGVARWAYAVSKVYDEHLCFAHIEKYKTRLTILRYFGGYGPNQNTSWWGGPQSVFIGVILAGQPMEIHGDGLQTRSFTYIDDLVDGTLRAMENKNANGEIFNLGDTREITILHLSELIWKLMKGDRPIERKFVPYATFFGGKYEDVRRRVPDIAKAKERLGFEPKMNLEKGLRIAIAWQTQISKASKDREVGGGD